MIVASVLCAGCLGSGYSKRGKLCSECGGEGYHKLTEGAVPDPTLPQTVRLARVPPGFLDLVAEAMAEAERAMQKHPQPNYVITKLAEEAGETVKAAIHHAEGRETREAVVSEMRQTIAMMLRLWIEGDEVHGMPALAARREGGVE